MCENFICIKLKKSDKNLFYSEGFLPEPCFETLNCQICELTYDCNFCLRREKCKSNKTKTQEKERTGKDSGKRN